MLNPQMKGRGYYEWLRQEAQTLQQSVKPDPPKTNFAPGSVEWQAAQDKSS
jgi:hypothetical protein